MRKILSFTLTLLIFGSLFVQGGKRTLNEEESAPPKELVDIKADVVYPYKVTPDSSVLCLVGNFAAQHNGAVITADSAVRYGDERLDCFGNVLINKNTTYAYADRAVYNGATNQIILYSPIIKVIDEDITLYTYNFSFNTLDNIGIYSGGGVTTNRDSNRLESMRGYYYADSKSVVGVEDVEIFTTDYLVHGDSVKYNMESDFVEFFDNTNIWNNNNEYLYTNLGDYDKELGLFTFTKDGYILNPEREVWSDSLEYYRQENEVILRSNIQMDDTTNKVLVYSDFAQYWGDIEKIFLSRRPMLVNYDLQYGDTMFMRADTIILTTHNREAELREGIEEVRSAAIVAEESDITTPQPKKEERKDERGGGDQRGGRAERGERPERGDRPERGGGERTERAERPERDDSEERDDREDRGDDRDDTPPVIDTTAMLQDSARVLTAKELKAQAKALKRKLKEEQKLIEAEQKPIEAEKISLERIRLRGEKLDAQKVREARKAAERRAKLEERLAKKGKSLPPLPEEAKGVVDSLDSLALGGLDSLLLDSLLLDSLQLDSIDLVRPDSIYRIVVAYRNTKTLQGGQQSISDSLTMDSRDTTLHLYIDPYMWSNENQVSSEIMDIYTANGELSHAIFTGRPIMASQIDTSFYNQVTGKIMTCYFVNNELTRNEVNANVQTVYFLQDDNTEEVTTLAYIESGSATFYFVDRELEGITYRAQPVYTFFPLDMIPATQITRLDGFEWRGADRPRRRDFNDRERRPSIRTEKEALPRPEFPIEANLRIDMESLMRDRRWVDRTDVVAAHAEEWLESLGYKSGEPRAEPIK